MNKKKTGHTGQVIPLAQFKAYELLRQSVWNIEDARKTLKEILAGDPGYSCRDGVLASLTELAHELHQLMCSIPKGDLQDRGKRAANEIEAVVHALRRGGNIS